MPSNNIVDFAYKIKDYMRGAEVVEGKNLAYSQENNAVIATIENGKSYKVRWTGSATITLKKNSASGTEVTSGSTSPLSFTADSDFDLYFGSSADVTEIMVYDGNDTDDTYVAYYVPVKDRSEVKVINASYTGASSTIKDISLDVQRVGKVVQFAIYFVTNTSVNAGATAELTLVNCPLPSYSGMRIIGFSGTYELIGWIESTGKVKIRFFGNTNEGASIVLTGTYLTND